MSQTLEHSYDLHVHSSFSDGLYAPEELAAQAARRGIRLLALCDHDTVAGLEPMKQAAAASVTPDGQRLRFIPSTELSAGQGNTHLLGYGLDAEYRPLLQLLEQMQKDRLERMAEMLKRLERLGVKLPEESRATLLGPNRGRAHLGRELVRQGAVKTLEEAFQRYLAQGKPVYAPRKLISAQEGVALLRRAGATPVLAHPMRLRMETPALYALILSLKEAGLAGVEAYHPSATKAEANALAAFARRNDLIVTGGSDYHGDANSRVRMGRFPGNEPLDPRLAALQAQDEAGNSRV